MVQRNRSPRYRAARAAGIGVLFACVLALPAGAHRAAAQGALRYLDTERSSLRQSLGEQSPWFVPAFVDDQVFDRLYTAVRTTLDSIVSDPSHPARDAIDAQLAELAARLRQPGPTRDRAAELQQRLVTHPQFREWSRGLWATVHADLDEGLASPNSDVRNAIAAAVAELATRLRDDEHTRRRLDTAIVEIARSVTERGGGEIGALIAETIDRWDPDEASRRIELAVGRDLQFIRINGTVVGGLAGLAIHAIGELVA